MNPKEHLLSIGEMAKLTGAGIHALRYYERKNILKPVYTDPDTGYRYYSFHQVNFVSMIINCVEYGIPLKAFAGVIESDDTDAFKAFLEHSVKAIERKSRLLQAAAESFEKALQKMEDAKRYQIGQIYHRAFEEKIYYARPCGQTLKERNLHAVVLEIVRDLYGENIHRTSDIDNLSDLISLPDVGFLCTCAPEGICYSGFAEMQQHFTHENAIGIPAGTYFFRQDETSKIEYARDIFKEQLAGVDTFMAIETEESFLGKDRVSQTIYELRLVPLGSEASGFATDSA